MKTWCAQGAQVQMQSHHYHCQVFFDNERWNCKEVSQLGVVCVYTPDGMTHELWEHGLQQYVKTTTQ